MKSSWIEQTLRAIAQRDFWWIEDLESVNLDTLRALDGRGWIEAQRHDLHALHKCSSWFSPTRFGSDDGRWAALAALKLRTVQIRATEAARAHLAELDLQEPEQKRQSLTAEEANQRASRLLKRQPSITLRTLARAIGCSPGRLATLPAWRGRQTAGKPARTSRPKTVALTDKVLATADDHQLRELIREQQADYEPSPLEPTQRQRS